MSMAVSNILGARQAGIFAIAMTVGNQLVTIGYYNMRTFQASDVTEKYSFADYCGFRGCDRDGDGGCRDCVDCGGRI